MNRLPVTAGCAVAVALLASGAGGIAAARSEEAPTAASTVPPADDLIAACTVDGDGTIADLSAFGALGEANTFGAALEASSIDTLLPDRAPFTILAPSNAAFDAVPGEVFDSILQDPVLLDAIVAQHVVAGRAYSFDQLIAGSPVATLGGGNLLSKIGTSADGRGVVSAAGAPQSVTSSAGVVCAAEFPDGTVYVVDSVLQPPPCATAGVPGSSVPDSSVANSSVPTSSAPTDSVPTDSVLRAGC